ncbi:MAG: glycoside hydrolase family 13 protein [Cytophagales bacterium]
MKKYLAALLLLQLLACKQAQKTEQKPPSGWWKESVVYQLYPRSFKDSNGDGVGDLKGIISKLDYLQSLGIDVIWLNPIYASPNYDNGYDISNYREINPEFGTMADFDELLNGLHQRNIKLIMDMVVNHSSSEHDWFKQSKSSRDNPYRNYYHWWSAEKGTPPYRFSFFDPEGAWGYDSTTNAYYLHYFAKQQPDLNWENPTLRREVYDVMKFWANKGIDGCRLDAFQFAAKDTTFPALPKGYEKQVVLYHAMKPQIHDYLKEMNQEVFTKYNLMTVAEGAGNSFDDAHALVDADRNELNMAYHFDAIDLGKTTGKLDLAEFKRIYSRWDSAFAQQGWLSIYLANHDNARMVSRFGNESEEFRIPSSKMLTTFIMTMRGTPYYYYGDELGMTNIRFTSIDQYRDIETLGKYQKVKKEGGDIAAFIEAQKRVARDNGRTPFQWDTTANAGFTTGNPWLPVNQNHKQVNRLQQEQDSASVLNYFRKAVKLRKLNPVLAHGTYQLVDESNPALYCYTRTQGNTKWLVVLNFTANIAQLNTDIKPEELTPLLHNYSTPPELKKIRPYEAVVYRVGN